MLEIYRQRRFALITQYLKSKKREIKNSIGRAAAGVVKYRADRCCFSCIVGVLFDENNKISEGISRVSL